MQAYYSANLIIDNLIFKNCGMFTKYSYLNSVICIINCGSVTVSQIDIEMPVNSGGIMLVNTEGLSNFTKSTITINGCYTQVHYGVMLNFTQSILYKMFLLISIRYHSSPPTHSARVLYYYYLFLYVRMVQSFNV